MLRRDEAVKKIEYRSFLGPATGMSSVPEALKTPVDGASATLAASIQQEVVYEGRIRELEKRLAQADSLTRDQAERIRQDCYAEAHIDAERRASERVEEKVASLQRLLGELDGARDDYFARVEGDVVKLALAIAARILHREAQIDALLLTASVRLALEQISEGSTAVLHVSAEKAAEWQSWVNGLESDGKALRVECDPAAQPGECRLKLSAGEVDLSVKSQLLEIERGFLDVLKHRTGHPPVAAAR